MPQGTYKDQNGVVRSNTTGQPVTDFGAQAGRLSFDQLGYQFMARRQYVDTMPNGH
jgi:hypothetical protein